MFVSTHYFTKIIQIRRLHNHNRNHEIIFQGGLLHPRLVFPQVAWDLMNSAWAPNCWMALMKRTLGVRWISMGFLGLFGSFALPFWARYVSWLKIMKTKQKALNIVQYYDSISFKLFNCWKVIVPKCLEPNPWNCEARSSSASRPPSATTAARARDTPAAAWDGIADINRPFSIALNLFCGNSLHIIAISQLCKSCLTLTVQFIQFIKDSNLIHCRVYDLFA